MLCSNRHRSLKVKITTWNQGLWSSQLAITCGADTVAAAAAVIALTSGWQCRRRQILKLRRKRQGKSRYASAFKLLNISKLRCMDLLGRKKQFNHLFDERSSCSKKGIYSAIWQAAPGFRPVLLCGCCGCFNYRRSDRHRVAAPCRLSVSYGFEFTNCVNH